eukprot:Awhi_evm1s11164
MWSPPPPIPLKDLTVQEAEKRCSEKTQVRKDCEKQFGKGQDICDGVAFREK